MMFTPPLLTRADLQQAWQKAALWGQNPSDEDRQREVRVAPITQWQIFYYRSDAWSNPLSSAGAPAEGQAAGAPVADSLVTPDGVRLVLILAPGQAISGVLTRDWMLPTVGGGK